MKKLLGSLQGNVKKKVNAHDEEDVSTLHYAARYNHHPLVKMLVEYGASKCLIVCLIINCVFSFKSTIFVDF